MLDGVDAQARGGTLILGGGFAGSYVAKLLKKQGATIVSVENFMLFASMLPEAASGTLELRHVVVRLRLMCPHADLVLGRAVAHDVERQRVQVETEEGLVNVTYRNLVVALGAISRTLPIPGLAAHASGFKALADAIALRNPILRRLEAATAAPTEAHRRRELTFVFVGAGYAGVEALAELADLVRDALRFYPETVRTTPQHWLLVDAAPKILPEIPSRLGEYAAEQLERRGVDIRVRTTLESVGPHEAVLSDGDRILTSTLVWTTGGRPHPLVARFGLPLDERGRVKVDSTFRVEGVPHVWALGDCARVPNEATPGQPDPPTSQHAPRQAPRPPKNLRRQPTQYGPLVVHTRLNRVHDLNFLRAHEPDNATAEELAAEAERVQGAAGISHRRVNLRDEEQRERLEPQFVAMGWQPERFVL